MMWWGSTKILATPKIVPKADALAHVVRKAISKLFESRERRDSKRSMKKNDSWFKMDPNSLRKTVKIGLKPSPLKSKKHQHPTVYQQRKRAEISWFLWNLLKSVTQKSQTVFSDEKIFTLKAKFFFLGQWLPNFLNLCTVNH